jgi:hypothetical protein
LVRVVTLPAASVAVMRSNAGNCRSLLSRRRSAALGRSRSVTTGAADDGGPGRQSNSHDSSFAL